MASISNSRKDLSLVGNNVTVTGDWEDIKDYTSALITINSPALLTDTSGQAVINPAHFQIEWAHTSGRALPTIQDIVVSENLFYTYGAAITRQYDHRARWFRVVFTSANNFKAGARSLIDYQTLYKRAPTELKIVDDQANVVSVQQGANGNSLFTLLTDSTGAAIRTTAADATGSSLHTHLADENGNSLATAGWTKVATHYANPVYITDVSFSLGTSTLTTGVIYSALNLPNKTHRVKFLYNGYKFIPQEFDPLNPTIIGPVDTSLDTSLTITSNFKVANANLQTNTEPAQNITGAPKITYTLSLARPNPSLMVGLRDSNNNALSTTGPTATNNALYIRPGDSNGNAQASTINVNGAATAGVALFAALSDNCGNQITTTKTKTNDNNALYVHLTTSDGLSVTKENPLPVISTAETTGASSFDIQNGVTWKLVAPTGDLTSVQTTPVSYQISLYNLFIYNDYATTVWVKVYDISSGALAKDPSLGAGEGKITAADNYGIKDFIEPLSNETVTTIQQGYNGTTMSNALKYNLTVQPGRSRDMAFPGGATFLNGIYIRVTTAYSKDAVNGPEENSVFINGTYLKETRAVA